MVLNLVFLYVKVLGMCDLDHSRLCFYLGRTRKKLSSSSQYSSQLTLKNGTCTVVQEKDMRRLKSMDIIRKEKKRIVVLYESV